LVRRAAVVRTSRTDPAICRDYMSRGRDHLASELVLTRRPTPGTVVGVADQNDPRCFQVAGTATGIMTLNVVPGLGCFSLRSAPCEHRRYPYRSPAPIPRCSVTRDRLARTGRKYETGVQARYQARCPEHRFPQNRRAQQRAETCVRRREFSALLSRLPIACNSRRDQPSPSSHLAPLHNRRRRSAPLPKERGRTAAAFFLRLRRCVATFKVIIPVAAPGA
jgi:hypothetical protein